MKFLVPLFILAIVASSCKKEDTDPNTGSSGPFTVTNTSFSELDLTQINNGDLFIMNLDVNADANGLNIDLNGDGTNDLRIIGEADQDWVGEATISSSNLSIITLNSNTFVLKDSIADSTFTISTSDTFNFSVGHYQLVSSYPDSGSVLTSEAMNSYVTHVDSNSILMANDPRWTFDYNAQVVRNHYRNSSTFDYGPDNNGYSHYIEDIQEYKRGIVPNYTLSWIPVKFVTDEGNVKMGFIRLKASLYNGFINVGVACWGIQR